MGQVERLDLLSKLASKAKRKLSKVTEDENAPKTKKAVYEFKKIDLKEQEFKLQKKIVHVIANNPDCDNPIGLLIDHEEYDSLSDERKQAYILKLSQNYQTICNKINY